MKVYRVQVWKFYMAIVVIKRNLFWFAGKVPPRHLPI